MNHLLARLQQHGIYLSNPRLLELALTHRSFVNERGEHPYPNLASNERLEFLGDAVLNAASGVWLYQHYPTYSEHDLTNQRSALVRTSTLARFARELELGQAVRLSRGEQHHRLHERDTLLADTFEAVLGAIFLDQGFAAVQQFIAPFLQSEMARIAAGEIEPDYRTRLQEVVQGLHGIQPTYTMLAAEGPAHERIFTMEVLMGERSLGIGQGRTKQIAAQAAAKAALATLAAEGLA